MFHGTEVQIIELLNTTNLDTHDVKWRHQ